jgi:isopentenyl diphosphate isomerase/L-lactate dehydrogenase-like FMN-dependent dehydrogenase
MLVKGIVASEDAQRALDIGADGVIISNHGGRQLDGVPATLRVLPEIRSAVGDDAVLLLDSGVRRGSDVVKTLALGANAAMIGRAYVYGLAAHGEPGVDLVLQMLRAELTNTMQLLGCPSITDLDRRWLRERTR